ncbi:DUF7535 family protein [Haloarcula laminariae]|uniref:DUF7535 family protein n=1 Tax=Haloarcula laminariae TaxID=2961577 RepID=UPI0021C69CB0|nr:MULTISPECIES: hypothetical protein [Halomicroarcula]
MSDADNADGSRLPEPLRTVTPPSGTHPDAQMDAIGWVILLGLLVLLLPVLPVLVVVWLIDTVRGSLGQ